jgi:hypothetical protein
MQPSYQSGFYAPGRGVAKHPELWRGCVGAWNPGLGNTGLSLRDWSGNQNNGVLTGGPTWGVSDGRQALDFDGVNDYVTTGKPASTFINKRSGTISIWYKPSGTSPVASNYYDGDGIVGAIPNAYFGLYRASIAGNDRIHAGVFDGFHKSIAAEYAIDDWTNLIWMISPTSLLFYKDGNLVGQTASSGPLVISETLTFGVVYINYAEGGINDVRTYKRTLSPNEIRLLARRPGIAYELAPRKTYFIQAATSTSRLYDVLSPLIFAGTN